ASEDVQLVVAILGRRFELPIDWQDGVGYVRTHLELEEVPLWNPRTHGPAERVKLSVHRLNDAELLAERMVCFREILADRTNGGFELAVNNTPIFCRGACWTIGDIENFGGSAERLRSILTTAAKAGLNMIRVGGTMSYESDDFYSLCDELGILVWQDFMFASMDYPADDADFLNNVRQEVEQQAARLRKFGSVAVFCGSSETEQQAAMFGKDRDTWQHPLFREKIPAWLDAMDVTQPYVPSSPCEGTLPMHNAVGISHYFGVGAYLQGHDDLERSRVRFASECLAFANVPSERTLKERFGVLAPAIHTPAWKTGVPRDSGTGWDFEDVRDHYLRELYNLDPNVLRYENNARYLYLSSVVSGEVMARTYDYWRTDGRCCGALVWFLNDIQQGAGWGLIDSDARAKPALDIVQESWKPIAIALRDRGMDGMSVAIHNAERETFAGQLRVCLYADSRRLVSDAAVPIRLSEGERLEIAIDEILGSFSDHLHRHRFGPQRQDTISVRLLDDDGELMHSRQRALSEIPLLAGDCTVNVTASETGDALIVTSDRALRRVRLSSPNTEFKKNYFDLLPGEKRRIEVQRRSEGAARGTVSAVNWLGESYFRC
ncbi:MAG: glycoside hydrolase family 2 protein, partial [Rhodothermales bacterium]|nr:glycoside hydrolase family 2 protein [Rhodothermales bacterium]